MKTIYLLFILAIGFLVVYITAPEPRLIIKHPNINNIKNTIFIDDNNVCYKYSASEIECNKVNNIEKSKV